MPCLAKNGLSGKRVLKLLISGLILLQVLFDFTPNRFLEHLDSVEPAPQGVLLQHLARLQAHAS